MGIAAYNRGTRVISKQISLNDRMIEFEFMEEMNYLPKNLDAGSPFGDVEITEGNGGFWVSCPITGYGFWYKTIREAMRSWGIAIYSRIGKRWIAKPIGPPGYVRSP